MSGSVIQEITIEKVFNGVYFVNRYLVSRGTPGAAVADVAPIVNMEKQFFGTGVSFTKARVSDGIPGTDSYIIVPLSGSGGVSSGSTQTPLFNTVRVDLGVNAGRPSRKYYRVSVASGQAEGQNWSTGYQETVQVNWNAMIASDVPLCDPDGQLIINAAVLRPVQMRQVRRGSRKKMQPII